MTADFEFEIGAQPPVADSAFEDFWTNFRSEVNWSSSNSTTRTELRTMLSEKYRSGFEATDLMHSTAEEAVNWASETVHGALDETPEDDAFAEYINLQVGLGGRALLAFDEVGWLLRGGYPQGAWTRVRTIHELFVVAATLGLHGMPDGEHPELVARYVCHHQVFTPSVARDLSAANPEVASILDDEVRQALHAKRQALTSQ
ncbi:DUF5677 domain-containing protein [Herbiconiux ginsengi]|uniref:DUF5677 domain-containing protein n=1 Tax=Herbiconiux ginsengi TaxID=381665 RepID=UPI0011146ECA|nr:DUF5677 domain-containing protein [Herbiconiux ginsengi]